MTIKRGAAPVTVEREIDVEITREEVIAVLGQFTKRKYGTDKMRFDDLNIVADKDATGSLRMSSVTLLGVEVLPLQYPEDHAPVQVQPTVIPVTNTKVSPPSALPSPLKDLAKAAAEQAKATDGK